MIKKKLIVLAIIIAALEVSAQEGTTSAYSYYGIGIQKFRGTAMNRSMGGLRTFSDATHINLQNPSSYAKLKLTTYALGASRRELTIKNENEKDRTAATTIDYLAIGIPAGKLGIGFGLTPYTAVGYNIRVEANDGLSLFSGTGGLNKAYLSFAYQITPAFSLGIETSYNFGFIEDKLITTRENTNLGSRDIRKSELSGLHYSIGASYQTKFTKNLNLETAFTLSPSTNLNAQNTREIGPFSGFNSNGVELTSAADTQNITMADNTIKLPTQFTLGIGIGAENKWFIGTEVSNQRANELGTRTTSNNPVSYENAFSSRIGGLYIPKYNSLTNYWSKITYRTGIRYEELGLKINNEPIKEFGMSFGLGLPIPRMFSTVNIGVEVGRRGTTNAGLVQENFTTIVLGLSLNDRWFIKRKYD